MNILKLAKHLKEFTLDEISMLAEKNVSTELKKYINKNLILFDGKKYTYISKIDKGLGIYLNLKQMVNAEILFSDICFDFLVNIEKEKSPVTLKSYKSIINSYFLPYFKDTKINDIHQENIKEFLLKEYIKRLSDRTVSNILTLLGSIFKYAQKQGYLNEIPYFGIRNAKNKTKKEIKLLDQKQLDCLMKNSSEDLKIFIKMILGTGMKKQEILSLMLDDIDFEDNKIDITHTTFDGRIIKSNFARTITLPKTIDKEILRKMLNSKLSPATKNNRLKAEFKKLVSKIGIPDYKFDNLRDLFCITYLKSYGYKKLRKQLGLPSITSLLKYGEYL
jgi:integrase